MICAALCLFLWYDAELLDDHLEHHSLLAQGRKQPVPLRCVGVAAAVGTASRQPCISIPPNSPTNIAAPATSRIRVPITASRLEPSMA